MPKLTIELTAQGDEKLAGLAKAKGTSKAGYIRLKLKLEPARSLGRPKKVSGK